MNNNATINDTILGYYAHNGISISNKKLLSAIQETNLKTLKYVYHAIKYLNGVVGIDDFLKGLAQINKSDFECERIHNNRLTELFALYFLNVELKYCIKEIEAGRHKILSPDAQRKNASCDIKASDGINEMYFEVKDASSEITTAHIKKGAVHFTPMDDDEIVTWIERRMADSKDKGASFLICRVPIWESLRSPSLTQWAEKAFNGSINKLSANEYKFITAKFNSWKYFKGAYIIAAERWIKLSV